jgi:uncharacterized membrane protein YbhN (UPF0104 family)
MRTSFLAGSRRSCAATGIVTVAMADLSDHDAVDELPAELDTRHLLRRVAQVGAIAVAVALAISALPGLGDVRARFADARPGWIVLAGVLELGSVLSYVAAFRGVFCPRLSWSFSAQIGLAEQAANVLLPAGGAGGLALGAWALRRGGMAVEHIARRSVAFFILTSSVNFFIAVIAGVGLALGVLPGDAALGLALIPAGLAAATITGVLLLPRILPDDPVPRGGRIRRAAVGSLRAVSDGVRDAVALVRAREPLVVLGAIGYLAFDAAALAASFAAFGGGLPVGVFLLAYVLGQLGGLIPIPGGLGGTDGGLIGALALFGTPLSAATAAVLAYRLFQLGLPAVLGTVAFVRLQRTLARAEAPAALCAPLAEPLPVVHLSSARA